MYISIILFLVGILGFLLNRKNLILIIVSLELILLAITILILITAFEFDDIQGVSFGAFIISVAGAESAVGLGILVAYYKLRGSINLSNN